jgi:YgiT-type zinc finger domain-containing protein
MQTPEQTSTKLYIEVAEEPLEVCANCKSASVSRAEVRSAFWNGEQLVVVQGIPALVCEDCGEQYFDDQTVVQLDLLRGAGFPTSEATAEIVVPVFSWKPSSPVAESAG